MTEGRSVSCLGWRREWKEEPFSFMTVMVVTNPTQLPKFTKPYILERRILLCIKMKNFNNKHGWPQGPTGGRLAL